MMDEAMMIKIKNRISKLNKVYNGIEIEFINESQFYLIRVTNLKTGKSKLISLDELNTAYDRMMTFVKVV